MLVIVTKSSFAQDNEKWSGKAGRPDRHDVKRDMTIHMDHGHGCGGHRGQGVHGKNSILQEDVRKFVDGRTESSGFIHVFSLEFYSFCTKLLFLC